MGSVYKGNINISVFGESHGSAIGVVIDNFPSGMKIDEDLLLFHLKRRAPSGAVYSTKRNEKDGFRILSGVKNGITEGTPICVVIENNDAKSSDYGNGIFRPSHADYTGFVRYKGFNDFSGGGHFSGRLTAPLVIAGTLCRQLLSQKHGVNLYSKINSIANIFDKEQELSEEKLKLLQDDIFAVFDQKSKADMLKEIENAANEGDSVGGSIRCYALGVKAGLGSPMMCGVESKLSSLLFSVPAVKGVEFGKGFDLAKMRGSTANDPIYAENGSFLTLTNNNGGILGGITNGMPVMFTAAIKPTPSIAIAQKTADSEGNNIDYNIKGRHDPCIVPRACVVIESVTAIGLLDLYLEATGYENN